MIIVFDQIYLLLWENYFIGFDKSVYFFLDFLIFIIRLLIMMILQFFVS